MHERHVTDQQQVLADLARAGGANRKQAALPINAAVTSEAQPVKIVSLVGYNVYSVQPVILGQIGTEPVPTAEATEAFNLAEPFQSSGTLTAGTYALMFRIADSNAFYAVP
ncbi:MAG: hypothetical protein JW993_02100 [Sedimentisphaerales bacterium]|nr:hypothetical protein [Sedimentisphaerales bacterium]